MRLTQSEVDVLSRNGQVNDSVEFPDGSVFAYQLNTDRACNAADASMESNNLIVTLPTDEVAQWAATDAVSIKAQQLLTGDRHLSILVEKDFACLSPRDEDEALDLYPHPEADSKRC